MSDLKATPGPWEVSTEGERTLYQVVAETPRGRFKSVCQVGGYFREHREHNAHLIAAAPEMYAELNGRALNALLGMIEDSGDAEMWAAAQGFMERRDELLRKARGE